LYDKDRVKMKKSSSSNKSNGGNVGEPINISDGIMNLSDKRLEDFKECSVEFNPKMESSKSISKAVKLVTAIATKSKGKIKSMTQRKPVVHEKGDGENLSTRGFLNGHVMKRNLLRLPKKSDISGFMPYVIPCTMVRLISHGFLALQIFTIVGSHYALFFRLESEESRRTLP